MFCLMRFLHEDTSIVSVQMLIYGEIGKLGSNKNHQILMVIV